MKNLFNTEVLIIGGGITGTGLARDLAMRGVSCVLVEKRDINAGAKELITACPKCPVHLTCAQSNEYVDIRVSDIYTHISECIDGG